MVGWRSAVIYTIIQSLPALWDQPSGLSNRRIGSFAPDEEPRGPRTPAQPVAAQGGPTARLAHFEIVGLPPLVARICSDHE